MTIKNRWKLNINYLLKQNRKRMYMNKIKRN